MNSAHCTCVTALLQTLSCYWQYLSPEKHCTMSSRLMKRLYSKSTRQSQVSKRQVKSPIYSFSFGNDLYIHSNMLTISKYIIKNSNIECNLLEHGLSYKWYCRYTLMRTCIVTALQKHENIYNKTPTKKSSRFTQKIYGNILPDMQKIYMAAWDKYRCNTENHNIDMTIF